MRRTRRFPQSCGSMITSRSFVLQQSSLTFGGSQVSPVFRSTSLTSSAPDYLSVVLFLLTSWWQDKIHYTDVGVAVRFLPLGTAGGLVATVGAKLAEKVPSKWVALAAEVLLIMGTIFFPFADQSDRYWPVIFPGMLLGTMGAMILYVTCRFVPLLLSLHLLSLTTLGFDSAVSPFSKPRRLRSQES
jgi:hypothetical protein